MLTFKNFNIADWFSFYRLFAAPFLLVLIWFDLRFIFTWLLLISYCTDAIDGYLARTLKITSARGSQLDSFAFIPYILQMLIAYFKYGKATAFHTCLAKLSAVLQSMFILWSLFFTPQYVLFYIMIIVGLLETFEEIALIFMYDNWASDVKGVFWALRDKRRLKKRLNVRIHS